MKKGFSCLLSLGLLVFFSLPGACQAGAGVFNPFLFLVTFPGKSSEIWSVASSGKLKLYKILPGSVVESTMEGSTAPLLGPRGKKMAIVRGNNLWIQNLPDGQPKKITKEGFVRDKLFEPVYPLISGWSKDGTKLVYCLKHAEQGEEGVEEGPQLKVKKLDYGYYLYDTESSKTHFLALDGYNFDGWTAANEMIFQQLNDATLILLGMDDQRREVVLQTPNINEVGQVFPGPHAEEAVAMVGQSGKWDLAVKLNLLDGTGKELAPQFKWGECNWPSLSPSGKKTAWIQTVRDDEGVVGSFLVVDNKITRKLQNVFKYQWMDEEKIVLFNSDKPGHFELLAIKSDDGQVLDRHSF